MSRARAIAARQFGLLTTAQLRALGLSRGAIKHRLAYGEWEWFLPGVIRIVGTPPSYEQDVMGVVLWGGDGSAAAGVCAARLRRLGGIKTEIVEVATTHRKDPRTVVLSSERRSVIHLVDSHLLPEIDIGPIPITSVRRTVLDLCGRRHVFAESALDHALGRELESLGSLWLYLEQEWMRGRRGVRILRDLLVPRTAGQAPTDSEMELEARRRIHEQGLPQPEGQYLVSLPSADIHLDLAYPELKLAIELDSYSWHLNRRSMENDRRRDNDLHVLGWVVLRFTWAMLRYDRQHVRETIAEMYATLTSSQRAL